MNYRVRIIRFVTFIGGLYFFLKFLLPKQLTLPNGGVFEFGKYNEEINIGLIAFIGVTVGLGLINLLMVHGGAVVFKRQGWGTSATLIVSLFVMLVVASLDWGSSLTVAERAKGIFILRDFATRIASDYKGGTIPGKNAPPVEQRVEILRERIAVEVQSLDELTSDVAPLADNMPSLKLLLTELPELKAKLAGEVAKLPTNQAEIADKLEPTLISISNSLGALGAKESEVLTLVETTSLTKKIYSFLFSGLFVSLGSAMFSLLGFYIASAAYRAFRVRSIESGLMMGAALLVILGQIPFAIFGDGWIGEHAQHYLPQIRLWILRQPNAAAFRAIEFGAAIAALVMAFRMWLSIEAESFSDREMKR